ncbi:MAG TPA: trypsin-like peptidase domain-containing protein, partial [Hyphomonadaceae bacterium]
MLPSADSEVEALQADIAALVPKLWKFDGGTPLADLLRIIARARALGAEGFPILKAFARRLFETRAFDDLYVLTSEMMSYGLTDEEGDIERWEIQALIELGVYETALDFARRMMAWGAKTKKGREGYSAVGRIYKQMYVNGVTGKSREEPAMLALYLERAFTAYMHVWQAEKSPATAYHAVNALAIGSRAVIDGVTPGDPGLKALADDVLNVLSHTKNEDGWTWATRAEAFVALGRHQDAAQAYAAFAFDGQVTLFQLHSAVRQLEEVWKLTGDDAATGASIRVLKAAIIAKLGEGEARAATDPKVSRLPVREAAPSFPLPAEARAPMFEASQVSMSAKEAGLIGREIAATPPGEPMRGLQQVFENNAPLGLKALRNGLARARAVCRIHTNIGGEDKGFASGFAIIGKLLNEAWGDKPVIVTNNHVISSRPNRASQRAELCEALFVNPDTAGESRVAFARVLWESDIDAHDIAVLELAGDLPQGVEALSMLPRTGLPPRMTDDSGIGRVYVIGFPAAGELSFSFADNILLDHDAPEGCDVTARADGSRRVSGVTPDPVRMHYKAPTKEGSSGSPVFDFNDYALLGVHRRGLPDMPRLRGREGAYAANEGVWIESIRAAIAESEALGDAEAAPGAPKRWRAIASTAAAMAATPLKSAAIAIGGTVAAQAGAARLLTGMPGLSATGMSPVATQILRSGKASAEEVKAVGSESIVGLDDRTRIFDTNMSPWRMICAIRCYWGSRLSVGTGALIGPNILLTAGHVVFPRDKRSAPNEIEIIPALNGSQRPYGGVKATQIWIHPRWQEGFELQSDVAAIELDKPVGHELGWFGLAAKTAEELRFEWAHVTGYPGEKQEAPATPGGRETAPVMAAQLWHHAAPIINVVNNR